MNPDRALVTASCDDSTTKNSQRRIFFDGAVLNAELQKCPGTSEIVTATILELCQDFSVQGSTLLIQDT